MPEPRYRIAGGQPTAKWWAATRVLLLAVALPLYNLVAVRYGWPALTDADGTAILDGAAVAWVAVAAVASRVAAWWTRPRLADTVVPD